MGSRPIFHITSASECRRLLTDGALAPPTLATEGFVHCSTADQVVATTARHFPGRVDLVLVELDPSLIEHEISWPEVHPGQHYPHVHGPLAADAVVTVHPWAEVDRRRWKPEPGGS